MSPNVSHAPLEDILAHIPCSRVLQYKAGDTIYREAVTPGNIYLVIAGMVKVSRISQASQEIVVDLYGPDEFFGLSAFMQQGGGGERASALKTAQLMSWPVNEIEAMIVRQPRLGIALLQMVVKRSMDFEQRVTGYSLDPIPSRLARSLLYLAERFGTRARDGSLQMTPFTHVLLSEYVGTSRAMVSKCMNGLRRDGHIGYSRRAIVIHPVPLERWLDGGPEAVPALDTPLA